MNPYEDQHGMFGGDNPLIRTVERTLSAREQAALTATNPLISMAYRPPMTAPAQDTTTPTADNPLAVRPKLPTPIPVPAPTFEPTSPAAPPPMTREVAVLLGAIPVPVIPPAKPIISARVADPTSRQTKQRIVDSGSSASAAAVADTAEPLYPTTMTPPPDEKKAGFPWWLLLVVAYVAPRRKK